MRPSASLEKESLKKLLSHDEYCNLTLHKMGYRKVNYHWISRMSRQEGHDRANPPECLAYRAKPSSSPPRAFDVLSPATPASPLSVDIEDNQGGESVF